MITIPLIDIRESGPLELLRQYHGKAIDLINGSRNAFGLVSYIASLIGAPVGDLISKRWLTKTQNPYLSEITAFANLLSVKGVYALNICYEWACTSGAYNKDDTIILNRVLDWPFKGLGENIVVAYQRGSVGDFYNVTWPGVSGIFNAMAPGKFSASLNQAPMRRYKTDIITDWVRNRIRVQKETGLPPAHLLRKAFESANNYAEAKTILCHEPVAIPVIYILGGVHPGEGCVIERLENAFFVREMQSNGNVSASNHFESHFNGLGEGWRPRTADSYHRINHACATDITLLDEKLSWFQAPIANPLSRLVMSADAGKNKLKVIGMSGITPVTSLFKL